MKVKGITGHFFCIDAQRLPLQLAFLMKFVLSQNSITQRGLWYLKEEFSVRDCANVFRNSTD